MGSIAAKEVAKEVIKTLGKSRKPNIGKIAREKGYSKHTADTPRNITDTKSYRDEIQPLVKQLEDERQAIIKRLKVTRNKAKYRDLIDGMDKVTKNIQLLSGKETETNRIVFMPIELMEKHGINKGTKGNSD